MEPDVITYDDAAHEYRVNGIVVDHVTGILKGLTDYSHIPQDKLWIAQERGIAVHRMVELHANGDLGELPEWMQPVLNEWERFCEETGFQVVASEQVVYNRRFRYAGRLDLKGTMRGQDGIGVVDIKRSFLAGAAIGIQTAAYFHADGQCKWRGALRLNENGRYVFEPHTRRDDWNDFLTCLAYKRLKERLGR